MKEEVFNLLTAFHLQLVRVKPAKGVIVDAKRILVDGDKKLKGSLRDEKTRAKRLANNLEGRLDDLARYNKAQWGDKCTIYSERYKSSPAQGVFDAVKDVLDNNTAYGTAARANDVNAQSVKSLLARIKRYNTFSGKLAKLTN